ncbi:MAG: Hsp70 family protein [Actinomycetia bacterium]|nr:Hsp70 family protein [Actinomycetes bacterium]
MSYSLGIDLGTTYTAAAVSTGDGRVEMLPLEHANPIIPSVVAIPAGETPIVGSAAQRRATTNPTAVAREFKRRFGDTTSILLDGQPHGSQQLMAHVVGWVVRRATAELGGPPASVAITHPANWGPYKRELLHDVGTLAGLTDAIYVPEPAAAASWYASQAKIEVGDTIAVYDFGGGTFDAVILRRDDQGFELAGPPAGVERLGGIDIDEMVVQFALRAAGIELGSLDVTDPALLAPMARLRDEARQAKEALSVDTSTDILVELASVRHQVRITRSEFEDLARPTIRDTVTSLQQAIEKAGLTVDDLSAVLLVGGSSRIPLVGEIVGFETGLPITADTHSKNSVALGAALLAHQGIDEPAEVPGSEAIAGAEPVGADLVASPPADEQVAEPRPLVLPESSPRRPSTPVLAAVGGVLALVAVAGFLLSRGGGDDPTDASTTTSPSATAAEPTDLDPAQGTTTTPASDPEQTTGDTAASGDEGSTTTDAGVGVAPGRFDTWLTGDLADPARSRDWQSPGPITRPSEVWRSADAIGGTAVAVDGVLYASFEDQTVRAIDLASGNEIWVRETSFGARTPTVTDEAVYFVDGFDVVAVDRATGTTELFRLAPGADDDPVSPEAPTVVDGRIYVAYSGSEDSIWTNNLVVVDLDSGRILWQWGTTSDRALLPVVVTDEVVALVANTEVLVVDRDTGGERWSHTLVGDLSPNEVLAADGALIVRDSRLRAFDLATGTEQWSTPDSSLQYAATDGLVFTHSLDTRALDSATGDLVWSTPWDGPLISGTIVIGDGVVYSHGSSNGGLAALDAATGTPLWSLTDDEAFRPGLPLLPHDGYLVGVDSQRRIVVYR